MIKQRPINVNVFLKSPLNNVIILSCVFPLQRLLRFTITSWFSIIKRKSHLKKRVVFLLKKLMVLMGAVAFLILVVFVINNSGDVSSSDNFDEQLIDALRVGVHYDIKNMGYQQYYDDELTGFEIEFSKQLAKHIYGKESLIELNSVSSKTAKYFLNNKTIDCIIATQVDTGEKNEDYKYSNPYYTDYIECMYANGSILSLNDLNGKKIGVITDSYAATTVKAMTDNAKLDVEYVEYEGISDGIDAMNLGRIDGFCTNRIFIPAANIKRFTVTQCKYSVMVRAADTELLKKINEAIAYMESSGELKVMQDKYR